MGNLNMLNEKKKEACLTMGLYAGCHTRWSGLESHLLVLRRVFVGLPPSVWLKLQVSVEKLPQDCVSPPPFSMAITFSTSHLHRGKT